MTDRLEQSKLKIAVRGINSKLERLEIMGNVELSVVEREYIMRSYATKEKVSYSKLLTLIKSIFQERLVHYKSELADIPDVPELSRLPAVYTAVIDDYQKRLDRVDELIARNATKVKDV